MARRLAEVEATRRRLLADLGHELRTPVATIEAYVDAAEDGVAVPDEDTWAVLRAQTGRLRRLTEDLAAVSRAEEHQLDLHPRRVTAADLVAAAAAAADTRYTDKGVTLATTGTADLPEVDADVERMAQVLGNLLDNALRHTPTGGTVTITTDRDRSVVRITVADTGEGITAEHLPHVFERFYRADAARDRSRGGSGIVRAIITEHGGRSPPTAAAPAPAPPSWSASPRPASSDEVPAAAGRRPWPAATPAPSRRPTQDGIVAAGSANRERKAPQRRTAR